METTLRHIIDRRAVDARLIAQLQRSLPMLLDDVPNRQRLTADSVAVTDDGGLRLLACEEGGGNVVADYGSLMLQALDTSTVRPRRLRGIAEACVKGTIADTASLRLALERCEAGNVHGWIVAAMIALLALLIWINNL